MPRSRLKKPKRVESGRIKRGNLPGVERRDDYRRVCRKLQGSVTVRSRGREYATVCDITQPETASQYSTATSHDRVPVTRIDRVAGAGKSAAVRQELRPQDSSN